MMHILFGVLTGAIAQCSYKCLKHDAYSAGVILGIRKAREKQKEG